MKELIEIFKYRLVSLNILLVTVSAVLMFEFKVFSLLTFVLAINLYDILGYHFTLIRRSTQLPDKVIIKAYRVHQLIFEILVIVLLGLLIGWTYSINCGIMKWFGTQDILYYIFLKKELPNKFTWMKWTPLGMIKGDLSKFDVIFQVIIGIILALIIILL
ncbi:MAG: hypothetical protein ACK4R9_12845 [Ignavibacterium sp.]